MKKRCKCRFFCLYGGWFTFSNRFCFSFFRRVHLLKIRRLFTPTIDRIYPKIRRVLSISPDHLTFRRVFVHLTDTVILQRVLSKQLIGCVHSMFPDRRNDLMCDPPLEILRFGFATAEDESVETGFVDDGYIWISPITLS